MIRAAAFALALSTASLVSTPAIADDPRLIELEYNPSQVVRINGKARVQATIMFAEDEVIENVAIGDSQSWQVTPNKRANLLFVKPLADNAVTNLTVVTSQRTYLFDLVANPRNQPVYVMSFRYPELEAAKAAAAELEARREANASEMAAANDPFAVLDPASLNFAWEKRGDASLHPVRAYDDGRATFLNWPSDRAVPAILITDSEGTEGPVNFTVRGETIVVQAVPRQIVLRHGDESALLINNGPVRPSPPLRDEAALARVEAEAQENN
ncbi:TrbG/VirB9 family P-type conjugative transfer protein [Altererythrobacter sp.]|uniref:TrbG/VirB9 family P-type conjugative transfer protein n=1 Tax=Altererythrobacter sp. TaxID=1872480 RepID=UPI001B2444B6|nr:TrbG/VirB9 family P-type conjugative transfer protein [Altererythrobacter sp.]MBO6609084.1 TrbG/VirB9 family P-type conjugative transfer protein [Altererythrobacter sp.]MBO6642623.1 TrbG/VirB9 family P-type conjugative transfer protein [Altererythrobacter sp.]MBO6708869.1 TrbG/VirB9 family P-type conjugative transfer protein [Altererythrobacter sp.]